MKDEEARGRAADGIQVIKPNWLDLRVDFQQSSECGETQ